MTKFVSSIFCQPLSFLALFQDGFRTITCAIEVNRQKSDGNPRRALSLLSLGSFFLYNQTIQIATRARELCNLLLYPNYRVLRGIRNSRCCYFARLHLDFFPRAKLITRFVFLVSGWFGEIVYTCTRDTIGRSTFFRKNYKILFGILSEISSLKNTSNNLLRQIEERMKKQFTWKSKLLLNTALLYSEFIVAYKL